jgi:hypothetical protein
VHHILKILVSVRSLILRAMKNSKQKAPVGAFCFYFVEEEWLEKTSNLTDETNLGICY